MPLQFNFAGAQRDLARYQESPTEDRVSQKTKNRRARMWEGWQDYAKGMKFDPEATWIELVLGSEEAIARCKSFMKAYVEASVKEQVVLGPEEVVTVPTIGAGTTLEDLWAALVKVADMKVMAPKRRENPRDAGFWTLTYNSQSKGSTEKTPYKIARWLPELAIELNLSLGQSFEKKEATEEDVMLILTTLWTRPQDIPCSPKVRAAFHAAVLLGAIGGWRPASLVQVKYRDVEIGWLRDPDDLKTYHPTAKVMVYHVKGKKGIRRDQKDRLGFWITKVPYAAVCILRFLMAMAVAEAAFENNYTTADQVLQRKLPVDAQVEYIPAAWKESMLDEKIIPISYHQFWEIWNRCVLVAGLQDEDKLRPYSLRVGTGGRLDGSLTAPLRNFILSNSSNVFETSYLPVNVRANLMKISFGGLVGDTDVLISRTRQAFLKRDDQAPVYITKDDWDAFEKRNDIQLLRHEYQGLPSQEEEAKRKLGKIKSIKDRLEMLLLLERRETYFQEANKLRERGLSTTHLFNSHMKDPRRRLHAMSSKAASKIGDLLIKQASHLDFANLLVDYIAGRLVNVAPLIAEENSQTLTAEQPRCLFGCGPFSNTTNLTKHVKKSHRFDQPFFCPECHRLGKEEGQVPTGAQAWSSHVARHHGKVHTPLVSEKSSYCHLCEISFTARGFKPHLTMKHDRPGQFQQPFPCPECQRQGKDGISIDGLDAWLSHVEYNHGGAKANHTWFGTTQYVDSLVGKKRTREQSNEPPKKRARHQLASVEHVEKQEPLIEDLHTERSSEWDFEMNPDPHAGEEFWVEGWD
ncbi:hypothetical protein B0J13DRAFT_612184 [Dactylonectria estremocensis]|uniref:C2H2-type domain-containing protein n=1 Tax=Dactylonectria estremocensis TaxID=1079267 RepID=A0A9P9IIK3_9HYPO|nr:hypothetical protein B0J13DRAFT_612184 [Dactylonectria estremocensis]